MAIFGNSTASGSIRLEESTTYAGDNYVAIAAPANVASSISFTLPDDYGTAGYVLSDTDGAGTLDWVAQSATGFDEIEAPSGDGSIDFGDTSQTITADIDEASGFMLELDHSAATLTNATTMLLFDIAETGGVDNAKAISVDTAGSETFYILGSGETWSAGSIESASHILTGADDTPDEAGEVQYDSTVAGIETGALAWDDGRRGPLYGRPGCTAHR